MTVKNICPVCLGHFNYVLYLKFNFFFYHQEYFPIEILTFVQFDFIYSCLYPVRKWSFDPETIIQNYKHVFLAFLLPYRPRYKQLISLFEHVKRGCCGIIECCMLFFTLHHSGTNKYGVYFFYKKPPALKVKTTTHIKRQHTGHVREF